MTKNSTLFEVLTLTEAEKKWGLKKNHLNKMIQRGKIDRISVRKSENVWLILRSEMYYMFGEPIGEENKDV